MFPTTSFIAIVAITLLKMSFFLSSGSHGSIKQENWNEKFTVFKDADKTIASFARVTNAIAVLNEVDSSSNIIKKIITEAVDFQDSTLLDSINPSLVLQVSENIKSLNSISVYQNNNTMKKIIMDFEKSISKETTPLTQQVLFSFNKTQLDFDIVPKSAKKAVSSLKQLLEQLKSFPSVPDDVLKTFYFVRGKISILRVSEKQYHISEGLTEFVHILNNISSFVVVLDKYKRLTSQTYLTGVFKKVERLLPYLSIIKRILKPGTKKHVMEQLQCIDRLMNSRDTLYAKRALIGFPQGSKDIKTLLKDLDGNQLKRFLNGGNFLSELKSFLLPMSNLSIQIEVAENMWAKSVKIKHAVRQSLKMFQNMEKLKLTAFTSFLNNVNATLKKLKPIENLNNSILNEFTQHLMSSQVFLNYRTEKEVLKKMLQKAFFLGEIFYNISRSIGNITQGNETMGILRKEDLGKYIPFLLSVNNKLSFFEENKPKILDLFSKIADFKPIFTKEILINIYELAETQKLFEFDIKEIINHINFIDSLIPLTKEEISGIDMLSKNFLATKGQIDKWKLTDKIVKSEIRRTNDFNRLKSFPYAWELTFQLIYLQRTLRFFKRRDLNQTFQAFNKHGMILTERMKSLPSFEQQLASSAWNNVALLNQSINTLSAVMQEMSSKILIQEQNLSSLADVMFSLEDSNIPLLKFELMIKSLDLFESSSVDLSLEVAAFKQSIQNVQDLQFAIMKRNGAISKLLTLADSFFKQFFSRQLKSKMDKSMLSSVFIFAVIIISVMILFIYWIMSVKAKKGGKGGKSVSVEKQNVCLE